jgi:hypothetical protein
MHVPSAFTTYKANKIVCFWRLSFFAVVYFIKKMAYISADLDFEQYQETLKKHEILEKHAAPWMSVVAIAHVTLAHSKSHPDEYTRQLKKNTTNEDRCVIQVNAVISTPRQVILRVVSGSIDSANKHPHVTVALAPGVQAVESNTILANLASGFSAYTNVEPLQCTIDASIRHHTTSYSKQTNK